MFPSEDPLLSVTVGEENLPSVTSEGQIEVRPEVSQSFVCRGESLTLASLQALHSALHTFDLMESLLVRIEELTGVKEQL